MRLHGRNGLIYLSVHHGDPATPLAFQAAWSVSYTPDLIDVTTITDTQHVHVEDLPGVSGTFTGFLDDATSQAYLAAADGLPRDMLLYPDAANAGRYFSGPVLADLSASGSAAAAAAITANWVAAGLVTRTGIGGVYPAVYAAVY